MVLINKIFVDLRSRRYKNQNALINQGKDKNQMLLSNYFNIKITTDIENVINNNREIEEILNSEEILEAFEIEKEMHVNQNANLLSALMKAASDNKYKVSKGRRYEESLKRFACVLYLLSGKMAYEILYSNLQSALPSLTTVKKLLDEETRSFKTGIIRIQELKQWLNNRGLERKVCVSEDQTKIVQSIQYNSKENCLDGFSLPLGCNGFPKENPYTAKNANDIKSSIDNGEVAPYMNIFMVQPLSQLKSSSFCLNVYPTNNRFNFNHCLQRWNFLKDLFSHEGKNN